MKWNLLIFLMLLSFNLTSFGQSIQPDEKIIFIDTKESLNKQLEEFKGKIVYLDMWSTFCAPCIKQFKFKKELSSFFENEEIVTLCVCVDYNKSIEKWKSLVKEHSVIGYHVFVEFKAMKIYKENFEISEKNKRSFGMSFPHFLIIDKNGNLVEERAMLPEYKEELINQLKNYLN